MEQLLGIARRRKWVILQAFAVVFVAALAYSLVQTEKYTASASLLFIDPPQVVANASNNASSDPTREAATNSALVQLPQVARYASNLLGGRVSPADILSSVTVDTGGGTSNLVTINAVSPSPGEAARIANAYGNGYIAFRRETDRAAIITSIQQLQGNLAALPPDQRSGAAGVQLQRQIATLQAAEALSTGGAKLVQSATAPVSPSSPNTKRNLALSVVVGIVLGFLLAALLDRLDQRLRTVDDLGRVYGLPILAEIPRSRQIAHPDLRQFDERPEAEPFRMLRTNLRYLSLRRELRSILVVSPMRGDGKSTIARHLAATMAAMGDRVVLVDADLHRHQTINSDRGLSTVLLGDPIENVLHSARVGVAADDDRRLDVLPAGPPTPNPSELLDGEGMRLLLRDLEEQYELVIVDGPATSAVSDSLALVPSVSGVLVIGGMGHTTAKTARDLCRQLDLLSGRPLGLVVNFSPPPPNGYGYSR